MAFLNICTNVNCKDESEFSVKQIVKPLLCTLFVLHECIQFFLSNDFICDPCSNGKIENERCWIERNRMRVQRCVRIKHKKNSKCDESFFIVVHISYLCLSYLQSRAQVKRYFFFFEATCWSSCMCRFVCILFERN